MLPQHAVNRIRMHASSCLLHLPVTAQGSKKRPLQIYAMSRRVKITPDRTSRPSRTLTPPNRVSLGQNCAFRAHRRRLVSYQLTDSPYAFGADDTSHFLSPRRQDSHCIECQHNGTPMAALDDCHGWRNGLDAAPSKVMDDKPDYRARLASDIWNRSLTASLNFCLHPMYRSVVWTEA
jgi:hypothetical protein